MIYASGGERVESSSEFRQVFVAASPLMKGNDPAAVIAKFIEIREISRYARMTGKPRYRNCLSEGLSELFVKFCNESSSRLKPVILPLHCNKQEK